MNKLIAVIFLLPFAAFLRGGSIQLNKAESYLRCSENPGSAISIHLNLGSVIQDNDAGITLPPEFGPFIKAYNPYPQISVHVALPATGEYLCQPTFHQVQTDIPASLTSDSELVQASKPYWLRDLRGMDIIVSPFSQQSGKLVIADNIRIDLTCRDTVTPESLSPQARKLNPYFLDIYRQHFINFDQRYEDLAEYGSMAVICPTDGDDVQIQQFRGLIQPWVDWKNQKGIPTTVYSTNDAGDTYDEIKDFIQNLYDSDPNLTFVQLVGDFAQVHCLVTTIFDNTGGMDAFYALLAGDDSYPDIFVGRFSAETAAELYTQVKRSLEYEKDPSNGAWLSRAAGVCSANPPLPGDDDEHNWEHLDNIRAQLLNYGYDEVDRVYDNEGATSQDLIACLNEGKSLVNYCGEGYPSHWVAPEFWVADAENLTNAGMLPFIHSVSCWIGQFYDGTCLAEAFMRSRNSTAEEARGAIAVYAAAPEQGIMPPMEAQDHAMELLVTGTKNTIGGLCYNGSCGMIDDYGENGVYNFLSWNLFGDASLVLRTKPAEDIDAVLPNEIPPNSDNLDVDAGAPDILVALSQDSLPVVSGFSGADGFAHLCISDHPEPGDRFLLTLSGFNRLPIQRNLNCFNNGDHPILDLAVEDSGQFIETEQEIIKTVWISNRGQIPAENVTVALQQSPQSQNLVPMAGEQNLGQILPGQSRQATLSYRVNKGTPDLATVHYSLWVAPSGGSYDYSDVVHAPSLILESVTRSPQINWINPGDTFSLAYKFRNAGSAAARDLHGVLESLSGHLLVRTQDENHLTLSPGSADSLVFTAMVHPGSQINGSVYTELQLDAANALENYWHQWRVIEAAKAMESFESHDLQAFPWLYQSDQWALSRSSFDGMYGLQSQQVGADSISLELSFISRQAGELGFFYGLSNPTGHDAWHCLVNESESHELASYHGLYQAVGLQEGANTIRWVGKRGPTNEKWSSELLLDAIQFPAQTVFDNAQLQPDQEQLEIILAPGEIRRVPLMLASRDGKYVHFEAVLQNSGSQEARSDGVRLSCNKTAFSPGALELFLFSLSNGSPARSLRQISITLPDKVLATSASAFSLPGQASVPFTGSLGSFTDLVWSSASGSLADSLRSGVRLSTDAGLRQLDLCYQIESADALGDIDVSEGEIGLACSDSLRECVSLASYEGEIQDEQQAELILTANQNLLQSGQAAYILNIHYNGNHALSIPVTVAYDPDPPGFFDSPHLANYPNPAVNSTTFAYAVPADGQTELTLYNVRGQRVRTLFQGFAGKGYYRTAWSLQDDNGHPVADGIYFCRLRTPAGRTKVIKCVVIN